MQRHAVTLVQVSEKEVLARGLTLRITLRVTLTYAEDIHEVGDRCLLLIVTYVTSVHPVSRLGETTPARNVTHWCVCQLNILEMS